jgi:anti-sigma28 factor (negative regulator of flagellin synthesis)
MTIKHIESPDVSNASLQKATGHDDVSTTPPTQQVPPAESLDDTIALSVASRFVRASEGAGEGDRLARILELKTAIQKNQYAIDPLAVSHALIAAELQGR